VFDQLQTKICLNAEDATFLYVPAGKNVDAMLSHIMSILNSGIYTADLFDDMPIFGDMVENYAAILDVVTNLKFSYVLPDARQDDYNATMMSIITPSGEAVRNEAYIKGRLSETLPSDPARNLAGAEELVFYNCDEDVLKLIIDMAGEFDGAPEFIGYVGPVLGVAEYLYNTMNASCGYNNRLRNVLQSIPVVGYGAPEVFADACSDTVAVYDSMVGDPASFYVEHGGRELLENLFEGGMGSLFSAAIGVDPVSGLVLEMVNMASDEMLDTTKKNEAIRNVHFCKYLQRGFEGFIRTAVSNGGASKCPTAIRDAMMLYLKSAYASYEPLLFRSKVSWYDMNDVTMVMGNDLLCQLSDAMSEMSLYNDAMLTKQPNKELPANALEGAYLERYYLEYLRSYEWVKCADYSVSGMVNMHKEAVGSIVMHDIDKDGRREMTLITNRAGSEEATAIVFTYYPYPGVGVNSMGVYSCTADAVVYGSDQTNEPNIVLSYAEGGTQYEVLLYCDKGNIWVMDENSYPAGSSGQSIVPPNWQQLPKYDIYATVTGP